MELGQRLTVDEVDRIGSTITLSGETQHQYQALLMKHSCKTPRALKAGDVVVVKSVAPNNDISVRAPCGCSLFLFTRTKVGGAAIHSRSA